jgi:mevalonate kinase
LSFQAYIDNIFAKTGLKPADFLKAAKKAGMFEEGVKVMQIVAWLKESYGLGHGHAMAIVQTFKDAGAISTKK